MGQVNVGRRGLMLVLSSPSGAGKTTISRRLLAEDEQLSMSVSATTRPPRPGEVEGIDYFFKSADEFERMVDRQEFLEHAQVFGHHYGTPLRPVEEMLRQGRDILFDIDWQGTQQLAQRLREDLVSVFILPPSTRELERRLKGRGQDSPEVVAERMAQAADEISHWAEYDYIVINEEVETCLKEVHSILVAERLKRVRRTGLIDFVNALREGK